MGNPLKDIFSSDEPQYKIDLKFCNSEAQNRFLDTIKISVEEERFIEVKGINRLDRYVETADGKHLIDKNEGESLELFVGPSSTDIVFDVDTDYGNYPLNLQRIIKETGSVVKTKESFPVSLRFTRVYGNSNLNVVYKSFPQQAENIEELVKALNVAYHFLRRIFCKQTNEEIETLLAMVQDTEQYWKRVREIEETLGVAFRPSEITESLETEGDIERLYLLFVKKIPIRRNINDVIYTVSSEISIKEHDIHIGKTMGFVTKGTLKYSIYGAIFDVNISEYYINAIIDSIESNTLLRTHKIRCIGSETKPLFVVQCGSHKKKKGIGIGEPLGCDLAQLAQAKTFNELMDQMQGEYHTSIRMQN